MRSRVLVALLVISLFSLFSPPGSAALSKNGKTTLTVFAASSLSRTFTHLGVSFEKTHPGVKVIFSFLASSTLAAQINSGAPADVFAAASEADMALAKSRVPRVTLFASNRIVLATPMGNSFNISKFSDLDKPGVKWIQCAHSAPCGLAADRALLANGRIKSKPVSLEAKVSSVVTKLVSKEVDAAFIYHTDYVANSQALKEIQFKDIEVGTTRYPIGIVKDGAHKGLAKEFIALVLSATGRKTLAEAGFIRVN
ncbi:MAG: molybdate ABC transporter substrate-binding protein [Actinobacteria bacterium]|nr:molybdate ABC transporter substrate-binding protein [Actinomycetota bacterium]